MHEFSRSPMFMSKCVHTASSLSVPTPLCNFGRIIWAQLICISNTSCNHPKQILEPEIQAPRGKEWQIGVGTFGLLAVWNLLTCFKIYITMITTSWLLKKKFYAQIIDIHSIKNKLTYLVWIWISQKELKIQWVTLTMIYTCDNQKVWSPLRLLSLTAKLK